MTGELMGFLGNTELFGVVKTAEGPVALVDGGGRIADGMKSCC